MSKPTNLLPAFLLIVLIGCMFTCTAVFRPAHTLTVAFALPHSFSVCVDLDFMLSTKVYCFIIIKRVKVISVMLFRSHGQRTPTAAATAAAYKDRNSKYLLCTSPINHYILPANYLVSGVTEDIFFGSHICLNRQHRYNQKTLLLNQHINDFFMENEH